MTYYICNIYFINNVTTAYAD